MSVSQTSDPSKPGSAPTGADTGGDDGNLGKKVAKGAVWTTLANVARIASAILVLPILARYLTPEDFGIVQIGMPIVLLLMIFNDVGLGPAMVREKAPTRTMWSTVFWTNAGMGVVLTGLLMATAAPLAWFFEEPRAEPVIQALAATTMLNCLTIVPGAWLQRTFQFKEMTIVELVSVSFGIAVALYCAIAGYGVWALVYQQVAMFSLKALMLWGFARTPVRFEYSIASIRHVIGFSGNMLGSRLVGFLTGNADNLIIGKALGVAALGYYSIAYRIMIMPVQIFAYGLTQVLMPALSQMQDDVPRMRAACLRTYRLIALITFPAMAGITALADPIIVFTLSEKMAPAGPVLALLAVIGAAQSLLSSQGATYVALKRADVLMRWSMVHLVVLSVAFLVGVRWGLMGAVSAYLVGYFIYAPFSFKALLRLIDATLLDLAAVLWKPVFLSVLMGCVVYAARVSMGPDADAFSVILVGIPLGVLVYGAGLLLLDRQAIHEGREIATTILSR